MTPKQAALYTRISQAEPGIDKVEAQEMRLRKVAKSSGYVVADVFVDDDVSAFRGRKLRPGFTRMLAGLKDGKYEVIMAVAPDRFTRGSATELEALQFLCVQAGATIHTIAAGVQDPATPMTRAILQIQDVIGGLEVDIRMERQHAAIQDDLAKGLAPKTRRPFGFEAVNGRVTGLDVVEAPAISAACASVLRGDSLYRVAKDWNHAGLRTTRGGLWLPSTVRQTLLRPRIAGYLTHRGVILEHNQPEIVTVEVWDAVVALLSDPARKPRRGPKAKALLSGILRCTCGYAMTSVTTQNLYKCSHRTPGTKHQSVSAELAEEVVITAVIEHIADGRLGEKEDGGSLRELQVQLTENARQTDAATNVLMDPDIRDKSRAKSRVLVLDAERERLEAERAKVFAHRAQGSAFEEFRSYMRDNPEDDRAADAAATDRAFVAWGELPVDKRRDIIRGGFLVSLKDGRGADRISVEQIQG